MSRNIYLERYAWQERLFPDYSPKQELNLIIVIPAYKEKFLLNALDSLNNCTKPKGGVLIIVVVNESEDVEKSTSEINLETLEQLASYQSNFELIYSHQKLPAKKAGVGLARKIGMDEAVKIFEDQGTDGVIACYDADCLCDENYLVEIEKQFSSKETKAGIVFYEHRLDGMNHDAILEYELYLRYYIDAIRFTGFPFAHQTLGSCIIVKSSTYQAEGGMNTRKAGEDFYFLNKTIPLGGFVEINTTTVYPSDRVSDRVPFGTGKAVAQLLDAIGAYSVYNPETFENLKTLFAQVSNLWEGSRIEIPEVIESFFEGRFLEEVTQIRKQTKTQETFLQRFFHWFDAFRILKYVHFTRDNFYPNVPLDNALEWLANVQQIDLEGSKEDQLHMLRKYDRQF